MGVVLIGDVPIPVVHEDDGTTGPSIYPYTDFYRKRYIYNHESNQFEVSVAAEATDHRHIQLFREVVADWSFKGQFVAMYDIRPTRRLADNAQ